MKTSYVDRSLNIFNVFFRYKLQWSFLEQSYCPCTLVSPLLSRYNCSDTAQISCYSTFEKNHQYQSYVSRSFLKRQQMQLWKKNLLWLLVNYCPSYSVWQDYKDFSKERNLHSKLHIYFYQQWKYFEKYREVSFVRELNYKISCRMNFMTSEESFLLFFALYSEWCELDFCRYLNL